MQESQKKFFFYVLIVLNILFIALLIALITGFQAVQETNRNLEGEIQRLQDMQSSAEQTEAQLTESQQGDSVTYGIPNPDSWKLVTHDEMGISLNIPEESGYQISQGKDSLVIIDPLQPVGTDAGRPVHVTYWKGKIKSLLDENGEQGGVDIFWNKSKIVIAMTQFSGDSSIYREYYIFNELSYEKIFSSDAVAGLYAKVVFDSTNDEVFKGAEAAGVTNYDHVRGIPDYIVQSISFSRE